MLCVTDVLRVASGSMTEKPTPKPTVIVAKTTKKKAPKKKEPKNDTTYAVIWKLLVLSLPCQTCLLDSQLHQGQGAYILFRLTWILI